MKGLVIEFKLPSIVLWNETFLINFAFSYLIPRKFADLVKYFEIFVIANCILPFVRRLALFSSFFEDMVFYDKDNMPEEIFLKIEKRVKRPKFRVSPLNFFILSFYF